MRDWDSRAAGGGAGAEAGAPVLVVADATEAGEAGAAPLLVELAVELAERQYLVAALEEAGPDREPKVLASRLERNRTRGSVLLSQLAALVPPDGPSLA